MNDPDVLRARAEEAAVRGEMARSMLLAARGRHSARIALVEQSMSDLHARLVPPAAAEAGAGDATAS
ncbi:MAG: hypothetical protein QOH43_576 [Solirubrobacteraceae bacterium]|jgi:hypothetical protein|nr:hypothetical protein [Solirubrobacteraceae bacterium]